MHRFLWALALLMCPTWLLAETIEGKLNYVYLNGNTITVDGETYTAITESTQVLYNGKSVGEESLKPGDEVVLVFSDEEAANGLKILHAVILVRGSKSGLDS
jgi:hypothetical protein